MDAAYIVFFRKVHTHKKCVLLPLLPNCRNSLLSKMEYLGRGWEVVRKLPNFSVFASASHSSFSGILWSSSTVSLYSVGPPTSCLVLSFDLECVPFYNLPSSVWGKWRRKALDASQPPFLSISNLEAINLDTGGQVFCVFTLLLVSYPQQEWLDGDFPTKLFKNTKLPSHSFHESLQNHISKNKGKKITTV